jgi:hypothetical protein
METVMHQTLSLRPASASASATVRRRRWTGGLCLGGLLLLSGCAGAKIENLSMAAHRSGPAPAVLGVEVALAPDLQGDAAANKAAHALQAGLVKQYRKAGLQALPNAGPPTAGSAAVRVRISRADPGDRMARLLIGFGAGQSALKTDASFTVADEADPAMRFSASAKSGHKPGLILPAGIAAATGEASRLAIGGGIGLLLEPRSSLSHEADRSAKAIVKQTRTLYRASGWTWPADAARG